MSDGESNHDEYDDNEDTSQLSNKSEGLEKLDLNKISFDEDSHVHFLPAKFVHTGKCKVDNYFTPLIIDNNNSLQGSLRGRKLNGIKKSVSNFNFYYTKYIKKEKKLEAEKVLKIKNYSIWKYDESIEHNNPLVNIERIIKELNILK
jgi:hypothetical protein